MASRIPKEVRKEQTDRWAAEVLYVALFQITSNCNNDGISLYSECTNECTGTNYIAGGKLLTSSSAYSSLGAILDANDSAWSALTLANSVRYAVVYVYSGINAGKIRGVFEMNADSAPSNGLYTIRWNTLGLIEVSEA